jgi:multicomponent Na+:H+ antiporter subunit D
MSAEMAIALGLAIPLFGMALMLLFGRWPNLRDTVMVLTAAGMFTTVLQLLPRVAAGERPSLHLFELMPGLSIAFEVEPLGMVFAMVASGLWIVTSLYAIGYMRGAKEKNQTRFYAFFAIALFSALGIAFAQNMFTLFVFYEILSLSTYPLVAHKGNEAAKRGARVYIGLLLGTSIGFMLLAIIGTWWLTGTLDFTDGGIMAGHVGHGMGAVLLVLYMFGIGKAALMPFHRWLPSAMVAPTPVSALLHAVAVVKAGVFTVLKVSIYLFGLDYMKELVTTDWIMYVAAFTMIAASLVAIQQDNLKARLAYSTVSQLSYIVLGAMLVSQLSAIGGGMHIVMHAFGKITLFFCAGRDLRGDQEDRDQPDGRARATHAVHHGGLPARGAVRDRRAADGRAVEQVAPDPRCRRHRTVADDRRVPGQHAAQYRLPDPTGGAGLPAAAEGWLCRWHPGGPAALRGAADLHRAGCLRAVLPGRTPAPAVERDVPRMIRRPLPSSLRGPAADAAVHAPAGK